jgi:ABC-type antimicrobial peptide transport system permease subunit
MEITFWSYIVQNPTQVLIWIVFCIGVVLSILYRKANPQKYTLTLIAFAIFLLDGIGNAIVFIRATNLESFVQREQSFVAYDCVSTPFWIAAWIMLFIALFQQNLVQAKQLDS